MEELLRRARRGDARAFLQIFEKYEPTLYRTAWLYVKNEQDALDVMQEAAFRALRGIRTLEKPQFVKTWLTRIVINCALDLLRKNGGITFFGVERIENEPRFSTAFESDALDRITLESLMNALTDAERCAVILKYCHGYTFAEMAGLMQLPLGTAKTILYRALDKLRAEA